MSLKSPVLFPSDATSGSELLLRLSSMKKRLNGYGCDKSHQLTEMTQLIEDCYLYILTNPKAENECLKSHEVFHDFLYNEGASIESPEMDNRVGSLTVQGYTTPPSSRSNSNEWIGSPTAGQLANHMEYIDIFCTQRDRSTAYCNNWSCSTYSATPTTP